MTLPWDVVAARLGIPRDMVEREAVKDYLRAEVRRVDEKIFALMLRYRVKTPEGLEEKIRRGEVEEHPSWEHLIEWEDMVTYRQKLLDLALQMEATV